MRCLCCFGWLYYPTILGLYGDYISSWFEQKKGGPCCFVWFNGMSSWVCWESVAHVCIWHVPKAMLRMARALRTQDGGTVGNLRESLGSCSVFLDEGSGGTEISAPPNKNMVHMDLKSASHFAWLKNVRHYTEGIECFFHFIVCNVYKTHGPYEINNRYATNVSLLVQVWNSNVWRVARVWLAWHCS